MGAIEVGGKVFSGFKFWVEVFLAFVFEMEGAEFKVDRDEVFAVVIIKA